MVSAFVKGREKYVWMFVCELLRLTSSFDDFSNKYLNLCRKIITDNDMYGGVYFSLHGPMEKNLSS